MYYIYSKLDWLIIYFNSLICNYSGTPPCEHPWNTDIHCNADTACGLESILLILSNPWNKDTPLIRTLWVGPKGARIRGVPLYSSHVNRTHLYTLLTQFVAFERLLTTLVFRKGSSKVMNCEWKMKSLWTESTLLVIHLKCYTHIYTHTLQIVQVPNFNLFTLPFLSCRLVMQLKTFWKV